MTQKDNDNERRNRERIIQGKEGIDQPDEGFREYLAELLPEVAPSLEERVVWLTEELIRSRRDHLGACRLAWELYLAGTGQTSETFSGVGRFGPVEEVRLAFLGAQLHVSPETRNVSDDNAPTEETP